MNIVILGTGQVGLTHAVVCAELGHRVVAFDRNAEKLAALRSGNSDQIKAYVNEARLVTRLRELRWTRLLFASRWTHLLDDVDVVFICIPAGRENSAARSDYRSTACQLAENLARRGTSRRCVVINKSVVPVGTARWLEGILHAHGLSDVGVASNPDVLLDGDALQAARRPCEIVVGADRPQVFRVVRTLYKSFVANARIRYVEASPEVAEAMTPNANAMADNEDEMSSRRMVKESLAISPCPVCAAPGLNRSAG